MYNTTLLVQKKKRNFSNIASRVFTRRRHSRPAQQEGPSTNTNFSGNHHQLSGHQLSSQQLEYYCCRRQWRRHGMDWGGHHPTFARGHS